MSDFLSRLVEHSRADLPLAIRPRVASAYEASPAAAWGGEEITQLGEEEAATAESASTRAPRSPRTTRPAVLAPSVPTPPWAVPVSSPAPLLPPVTPGSSVDDAPVLAPPADPGESGNAPPAMPRRGAAPAAARTERPRSRDHPPPITPRIAAAEAPQHAPVPRRSNGETSREDGAAPVVRVTIGRIEVRAVTEAPTPAPTQRRPGPSKLSLDDYLRQRRQGER